MSPVPVPRSAFAGQVAAFATAALGVVAAIATTLGGCAPPPAVQAAVAAPPSRALALEVFARGPQANECVPHAAGSRPHAWRLRRGPPLIEEVPLPA